MIHSLQRTDQIYIKSIHIFSVSFRHPNDLKYGHSGLDVNGYGYLQQPQRLTTHQLATKNSINIINVINFEDIFANDVENKDEIDFHEKTWRRRSTNKQSTNNQQTNNQQSNNQQANINKQTNNKTN